MNSLCFVVLLTAWVLCLIQSFKANEWGLMVVHFLTFIFVFLRACFLVLLILLASAFVLVVLAVNSFTFWLDYSVYYFNPVWIMCKCLDLLCKNVETMTWFSVVLFTMLCSMADLLWCCKVCMCAEPCSLCGRANPSHWRSKACMSV